MMLCRMEVVIPGCATTDEDVAVGCDADICVHATSRDDNHTGVREWQCRAASDTEATCVSRAGKLEGCD